MPGYNDLRPAGDNDRKGYAQVFPDLKDEDRKAMIPKILRLREGLGKLIPKKKSDENLLISSWNLKEFGHLSKRRPESYFYIAETISKFDITAIQEIKSSLTDLKIIMKLLGPSFRYIITDITEGNDGNSERFGYIYDERKVIPSGLSGELVLWDDITKNSTVKQFKRTPAITGFKAGWKSFIILNIHLHPGNSSEDRDIREQEIQLLINAINEKKKRGHLWNENIIVLGDTNLYRNNTEMVELFTGNDFIESKGLKNKYTNVSDNEIYDRIFLRVNDFFELTRNESGESKGDVFPIFEYVFTKQEVIDYHGVMMEHKEDPSTLRSDEDFSSYFHNYWKRGQISDHNPIWIEVSIDSSDKFLREKLSEMI